MENIRTVMTNLPSSIDGFTVASGDGWYTIVLNSNLSYERNRKTYFHELEHVLYSDFSSKYSVDCIEQCAHH